VTTFLSYTFSRKNQIMGGKIFSNFRLFVLSCRCGGPKEGVLGALSIELQ